MTEFVRSPAVSMNYAFRFIRQVGIFHSYQRTNITFRVRTMRHTGGLGSQADALHGLPDLTDGGWPDRLLSEWRV